MPKSKITTHCPSLPYPIPSLLMPFSPKSPTSPLETTKHFSNCSNKIGLGLVVDVLNNEETTTDKNKSFLFGSQLKIKVPTILELNPASSPRSPIEFGVKTKDTQLALLSPVVSFHSPSPSPFSTQILSEMELSEDYTCVISHGPNPKTVHIFDNCVVESCNGATIFGLRKVSSADGFLSFCHACKKNLSQGNDIFMYRGERAFCSEECRGREMLFDDNGREEFS